jgi:hypothetical protein
MKLQGMDAENEEVRDAISAARDLTIPWWVDTHCPGCGAIDGQLNANAVNRAADPDYKHSCGYVGPWEWVNPYPPRAVWEERRRLQGLQLSENRNMDNLSPQPEVGRSSA